MSAKKRELHGEGKFEFKTEVSEKWEQEGHERKVENKIATILHPASAAKTDQRVCGYYIRYTEGARILVKITYE